MYLHWCRGAGNECFDAVVMMVSAGCCLRIIYFMLIHSMYIYTEKHWLVPKMWSLSWCMRCKIAAALCKKQKLLFWNWPNERFLPLPNKIPALLQEKHLHVPFAQRLEVGKRKRTVVFVSATLQQRQFFFFFAQPSFLEKWGPSAGQWTCSGAQQRLVPPTLWWEPQAKAEKPL